MRRVHQRALPLVFSWLGGASLIVMSGFQVDGYLLHVEGVPLPHPYPYEGVIVAVLLVTFEIVMLHAVLRPRSYERSWGRSLVALLIVLGALAGALLSSIHAPPYVMAHVLWLGLLALVLSVLLLVSGVAALAAKHRSRS